MENFDYGMGYVSDRGQFVNHTPHITVDFYLRPLRVTRLNLAMWVCGPSFSNPPQSVLIYKPTKHQERKNPTFIWSEPRTTLDRLIEEYTNDLCVGYIFSSNR